MSHAAFVFDAYGTLFDVHAAVRKHADRVGPDGQLFSEIWRAKQLEYSWTRTLMGAYRDFWVLTEEALDYAFARVPSADRSLRAELLEAYFKLDCYPEVSSVLKALKETGSKVAILSLGTRLEEAKKAADQLEAKGLSTTVADMRFAKPLDTALIEKLMRSHEVVVTIEEAAIGGLGAHVLTYASDEGLTDNGLKVRTMRLPDTFQDQDDPMKQYDEAGLNAPHIVDTVLNALRHNSAGVEEARA